MSFKPEIELSNMMANRIVGSVFWDESLAVERQHRRYLNAHVVHMVHEHVTSYETQLDNGDEEDHGIDVETQLRAREVFNDDGTRTTHFRIQCRFSSPIDESDVIGFDQTGRIVNEFARVDSVDVVFLESSGFTPWEMDGPNNGG